MSAILPHTKFYRLRFKTQRVGYLSLCLFLLLLLSSFFAECITKNKPFPGYHNHLFYSPIIITKNEFNSKTLLSGHYHEPKNNTIMTQNDVMPWPLFRDNGQTLNYDYHANAPSPPSAIHWLGTTETGQDVFAILLYSFRSLVLFTLLFTLCVVILGIGVGSLAGYYGGYTSLGGQYFFAIWSEQPHFFFILLLTTLVDPNIFWLPMVVAVFSWGPLAKSIRREILQKRQCQYVLAAKALGVQTWPLICRHVLPNVLVITLSHIPFLFSSGILAIVSLDFLDIGPGADMPSLGRLLWQGKNTLYAPWIGLSAVATLVVLLFLLYNIDRTIRLLFQQYR